MLIDCWRGPFTAALHESFLADYWQKRPLLIRNFLPANTLSELCPLTVDDLLDLASGGGDESLSAQSPNPPRLIRESGGARPWMRSQGPFSPEYLQEMREGSETADADESSRQFTVLVNGVEQLVPEVEALHESAELWGFVPRWRLDDVMVSYAPPGGSVGAHVDNFDVFLLQGSGSRVWSVEDTPRAASEEICIPGLDVRVLSEFEASDCWELQPGDALYVPPRYAHHGVSSHADCLTYSIGFRAPSLAEMLTSFARHAARSLPEDVRYTDADLPAVYDAVERRGAVEPHTVHKVRALLRDAIDGVLDNDDAFEAWIGEVLTEPKSAGAIASAPSSDAEDVADGGPAELGPAARQAMAEWVASLGPGQDGGNPSGVDEGEDDDDDDDGDEEARELEAELAEMMGSFGDLDAPDVSLDTDPSEEGAGAFDALGSVAELLCAIADEADDAPAALRRAEGVTLALVRHSTEGGGASVFVDGVKAATVTEPRAIDLALALCSSSRTQATLLAEALRESAELRALVEKLVRDDVLWVEV